MFTTESTLASLLPALSFKSNGCIPPLNWVKLNSDGPSLGNPGQAGGGGLIRDSNGVWIRG